MQTAAGRLYLFAGGGTGGHLFPGLAVATALKVADPDARVEFVGSNRPLERELVERHGYRLRALPAESLAMLRKHPVRFVWNNAAAYFSAHRWLSEARPACVVGLGGFASAPLVLAARQQGVPVVLLEQNAIPGRTTRWLSRRAALVCLSFAGSAARFSRAERLRLTGNPVRPEIADLSSHPCSATGQPTLLILGGSQGAQPLNAAGLEFAASEKPRLSDWRIVHQTGAAQHEETQQRYAALGIEAVCEPFLHDLPHWYRQATLVISRAGATTLAELACAGLPAVLVPFPEAADNHQMRNAEVFAAAGAACIVEQESDAQATAARLVDVCLPLITDPAARSALAQGMRSLARPQAAQDVAEAILRLSQ